MPDEVEGKPLGKFGYYIRIKSPELSTDAMVVAWKKPEDEMKRLEAKASIPKLEAGAAYQTESAAASWNNVIITKEYGMLPVDVWRQKVAFGLGTATGNQIPVGNVSSPVFVAPSGAVTSPRRYIISMCSHCHSILEDISLTVCPSCGKSLS
jgi:hypothetical protein